MNLAELDFENVANGALVFIVGLLSWLGIRGGRNAKPQTAEIAAGIIDAASATKISGAIEAHTAELHACRKQAERMERIGEEVGDAIASMTLEIRSLREELIRSKK